MATPNSQKVMGHSTTVDVLAGRTTEINRMGNNAADELAVTGATNNTAAWPERQKRQQHCRIALRIQKIMLEILLASSQGHSPAEGPAASANSETSVYSDSEAPSDEESSKSSSCRPPVRRRGRGAPEAPD